MSAFMPAEVAARRYPHGTRARSQLGRCDCFPCHVANTNYETMRQAWLRKPWRVHCVGEGRYWIVRCAETKEIACKTTDRSEAYRRRDELNRDHLSDWSGELVSTSLVRQHMAWLATRGIGLRTVGIRSGVSRSVLQRIERGKIRRTRRSTAHRILSIGAAEASDGAVIDAGPTWVLIADLLAAGYTKGWIAQRLGAKTPALQIRRDRCLASTARRVRKLYVATFRARREATPEERRAAEREQPADYQRSYRARRAVA